MAGQGRPPAGVSVAGGLTGVPAGARTAVADIETLWVGLSYDGRIVTGWAVIAAEKDEIPERIRDLIASDGQGPPL